MKKYIPKSVVIWLSCAGVLAILYLSTEISTPSGQENWVGFFLVMGGLWFLGLLAVILFLVWFAKALFGGRKAKKQELLTSEEKQQLQFYQDNTPDQDE